MVLLRLVPDSINGGKGVSEDAVRATYAILQQLLPGEKQDAAQLAMGQTYEQLDKNEVGRLGKRGEEVVPAGILTLHKYSNLKTRLRFQFRRSLDKL